MPYLKLKHGEEIALELVARVAAKKLLDGRVKVEVQDCRLIPMKREDRKQASNRSLPKP